MRTLCQRAQANIDPHLSTRQGKVVRRGSVSPMVLVETQIALRVMMEPERASDVPTQLLNALPRELIEHIAMAPRCCRIVGAKYLLANCFTVYPDRECPPVLGYVSWLAATPQKVRLSVPSLDELLRELAGIASRARAE